MFETTWKFPDTHLPNTTRVVTLTFSHNTYVMPPTTRSQHDALGQTALMIYQQWLWQVHRQWMRWVKIVKRALRHLAELRRQDAYGSYDSDYDWDELNAFN